MKVFLYLRISTDMQQLDPQRLELLSYCKDKGFEITGEFSDILSGARRGRPGLNAMLARCALGEVQAVLVVKIDRLARSLRDFVALTEQLDAHGVGLICTSQAIDTSKASPTGQLLQHLLAAIAQFERSLISERVRSGLAVAREGGKILGRPSPVLLPNWREIVAAWKAAGGTSYGTLARQLGGVSKSTAWRLANGRDGGSSVNKM